MHAERSTQSMLDTVATPYLQKSSHGTDLAELKAWQPRRTLWNYVRRGQTMLSGLQRKHLWQDQHRITYLEGGQRQGEPLLLLHGFGANKENWLFLAALLGSQYRLIIPDLPGFGESHFIATSDYRLATQADRVARLMAQLELPAAHLVGNSMGGAIAGIVAARYPQQVASLTLMNAAGLAGANPSRFEAALRDGRNPLIPRNLLDVIALFRITTHRNRQALTSVLSPVLAPDMTHRYPVNHRIFRDMLAVDEDPLALFSSINCPTLIMWGDQDQVLDVSAADSFKQLIPHAQMKIFKEVGHLPMLEVPLPTARALKRFWHGLKH
ncbi:alpha/beta fold hydrolase [Isoalcanivorax beigongshangi]|uniref:Alpha/beta fold hydrolase n=1 Tax=Isoalcanivorax beigongshangi TaxID=3238810 RepID=A0ABV4AG82_9GAMM